MALNWYVIHTYSGHEEKVKNSIEKAVESQCLLNQIEKLVIPTEEVVEIRRNKKQVKKRKFFPGYVLVSMDVNNHTYWLVRNTAGVTGFLGGVKPVPLPEAEVQQLLKLAEKRARNKSHRMIRVGASVTAVAFYRKHGYKTIRREEDASHGTVYYMEKRL